MPIQPVLDRTTIIMIGFWNPAILQPEWLARNVFEIALPATIPVQMEFSPIAGQPPRFLMDGVKIIPAYDRLALSTDSLDVERLRSCERCASHILEVLPHTPVQGVGINFEFVDDNPSERVLQMFSDTENLAETSGLNFVITTTSLTRALSMEETLLNFTRELDAFGHTLFRFNFHYAVTDAKAAIRVFDDAMVKNLARAMKVLETYK